MPNSRGSPSSKSAVDNTVYSCYYCTYQSSERFDVCILCKEDQGVKMIRLHCPGCNVRLRVPYAAVYTAPCPQCGYVRKRERTPEQSVQFAFVDMIIMLCMGLILSYGLYMVIMSVS